MRVHLQVRVAAAAVRRTIVTEVRTYGPENKDVDTRQKSEKEAKLQKMEDRISNAGRRPEKRKIRNRRSKVRRAGLVKDSDCLSV